MLRRPTARPRFTGRHTATVRDGGRTDSRRRQRQGGELLWRHTLSLAYQRQRDIGRAPLKAGADANTTLRDGDGIDDGVSAGNVKAAPGHGANPNALKATRGQTA